MKRFLLSCLLFSVAFVNRSNAQSCSVGIPTVSNVVTSTSTDSCFVTFDLSFAMKNNSGNKTIGIDLWQSVDYPTSLTYAKVPSATDLVNALGSIMINNNFTGSPINVTYYSTYPSGSSVRILRTGPGTRTYNQSVDSFYFNISGIKLAVKKATDGTCPVSMLTVKGNVWSTNAGSYNASTTVQCVSSIEFSLGNPTIPSGLRQCTSPRTLDFRIETSSPTDITVTYKIFKDDGYLNSANKAVFDPSQDVDVTLAGTQPITNLSASNPYIASSIGYVGANDTKFDGDAAFWVVVYYTQPGGQTYSVSRLINNQCASTLPVAFKSFTATKGTNSNVLKWTTATEANSKGFYVQRYYNGKWENVMFVATKAEGGNSQSDLNYTYTDNSVVSGTVQYRILQLDLNGAIKYSDIRAIRDALQSSRLLVYPNPATNGTVSIVLDDANAFYDIQVIDGSGRIVKQFNTVRNIQQVSSLPRGQYLAKVINQQNGESKVEKFIILH